MGKVKATAYDKRKILQALAARQITKEEARYLLSTTIAERTIKTTDPANDQLTDLCERAGLFLIEICS